MATIDEIKQQAEAVKNASHIGENTALRVGGVLVDLCECMKNFSGGGTSGGSGVSLGTLLTKLNSDNPFPTASGQVLTYNGSDFTWKAPTTSGGASGGTGGGIRIKRNGSTLKDSNGDVLSCTSINFKYGGNWNSTPILINSDNEISVDLSVVANNGNGGSSSTLYPFTIYNGSSDNDYITYDGSSAAYLKFKSGFSISKVGLGYEISASGSGGSSGTTSGRLRFYKDSSEESWNGESDFKIIFGSGLNVTWDSHSQITLSATGGSSGGSSGGSVSWENVTGKPSTFTPSSHTHSTSDINGLDSYVKGTKVSNANAADRLANAVTLWGNSFSGNNSIGTASSRADLKYVKDIYAGDTFDIKAGSNNNSLLKVDGTPSIYVGFGYMANANASLLLFGNKTTIYTSGDDYRYDFKGGVFDVNTNTIHFGPEAGGGKISWDRTNNAFKIEGNVYATGGITALGVSNSSTTSNNVDFTFKSVTIPGNKQDKVQLTDEGLVFNIQNDTKAYYKRDSIALYNSANDDCVTVFSFTDSQLNFDPEKYGFDIYFNTAMSCNTEENTLNIGIGASAGYIVFRGQSTMRFIYNNRTFNFNIAKAIEQGILTV